LATFFESVRAHRSFFILLTFFNLLLAFCSSFPIFHPPPFLSFIVSLLRSHFVTGGAFLTSWGSSAVVPLPSTKVLPFFRSTARRLISTVSARLLGPVPQGSVDFPPRLAFYMTQTPSTFPELPPSCLGFLGSPQSRASFPVEAAFVSFFLSSPGREDLPFGMNPFFFPGYSLTRLLSRHGPHPGLPLLAGRSPIKNETAPPCLSPSRRPPLLPTSSFSLSL